VRAVTADIARRRQSLIGAGGQRVRPRPPLSLVRPLLPRPSAEQSASAV